MSSIHGTAILLVGLTVVACGQSYGRELTAPVTVGANQWLPDCNCLGMVGIRQSGMGPVGVTQWSTHCNAGVAFSAQAPCVMGSVFGSGPNQYGTIVVRP